MTVNLDNFREEFMNYLDNGKLKLGLKLLNTAFRSIEQTDIPRFGDLLGEFARKYPELFEKIYIAFQYQLRHNFPQETLYKLDKYFIEKYCLLENETITDSFIGALTDKYNFIKGRIFLTNLRLIVSGYPKPIDKKFTPKPSFSSLRREIIHIYIGVAIRKALKKDIKDLEIINYGHYYPIYNAYKINRAKKRVSYKVDVEYERKGKTKVENMTITVSPGKMKEDLVRKEEILSNIEKILVLNQ